MKQIVKTIADKTIEYIPGLPNQDELAQRQSAYPIRFKIPGFFR